jgi:shikimate kinase
VASDRAGRHGRSIALVGFMAAGKSKIGRRLADQLGMPFVDTDLEIEAVRGMPVAEIFAREGEAEFRRAECEILVRLLGGEAKVIAIGGGAFVDPENRARLKEASRTVWLDPPFEVLLSRLARSNARPLATGRSEGELRTLWEKRRSSYAQADLHIATSDEDPQRYVDEIIAQLN